MILKYLDLLKNFKLEDEDLNKIILSSFDFYLNRSNSENLDFIKQDQTRQKAFSQLLRFFKSFNSNKKIDDGILNQYLKEVLKEKNNSINLILEKTKDIISIQTKRINFSDDFSIKHLNYFSNDKKYYVEDPFGFLESYLYQIKNFSFKINVIISNESSNRILIPEIFLYMTLNNGRTLCAYIDLKVFQELRKCLAINIKRIIDNEAVNFLK